MAFPHLFVVYSSRMGNQPHNSSNRIAPNRDCGADIPPRSEGRMQLPGLQKHSKTMGNPL